MIVFICWSHLYKLFRCINMRYHKLIPAEVKKCIICKLKQLLCSKFTLEPHRKKLVIIMQVRATFM